MKNYCTRQIINIWCARSIFCSCGAGDGLPSDLQAKLDNAKKGDDAEIDLDDDGNDDDNEDNNTNDSSNQQHAGRTASYFR